VKLNPNTTGSKGGGTRERAPQQQTFFVPGGEKILIQKIRKTKKPTSAGAGILKRGDWGIEPL